MDSHLNRDQIAEWIVDADGFANDHAASRHFDACEACRMGATELRQTYDEFRNAVHTAAQRDDLYWRTQQAVVAGKLCAQARIGYWHWFPAAAASLVLAGVLVAAMLWPRSPKPAPVATDESDAALLQSIQNDLGREYPRALAPAVLITNERTELLTGQLQPQSAGTQDHRSQEQNSQ